jgi:hypothetical protein
MKARIATLLSVAGVLVAGSAAALVNTQVLAGGGSDATGQVDALAATTSAAPATTPTTPVSVVAAGAGSPANPTQVAYVVGEAGVVTLDAAAGVLTVVSVQPSPGWRVAGIGTSGVGGQDVVLSNGAVEVTFSALVVDGEVVTAVSSRSLAPATAPPSSAADDDGFDDDHDDDREDHEDGRDDEDDEDHEGRDDDD